MYYPVMSRDNPKAESTAGVGFENAILDCEQTNTTSDNRIGIPLTYSLTTESFFTDR